MTTVFLRDKLAELISTNDARDYIRPQNKKIIIVFTPRSGSSWLTNMMKQTSKLGQPDEYLNHSNVEYIPLMARTEYNYLSGIEHITSQSSPVFSMKVTWADIEGLSDVDFFQFYKHANFIHLRRRDIVAQAVSLLLANETGIFHRVNGQNIMSPTAERRLQSLDEIDSSMINLIRYWCCHLCRLEWLTEYAFLHNSITPMALYYEDLIASPIHVIEKIGKICYSEFNAIFKIDEHEKLERPLALEMCETFNFYEKKFINDLAELRPR